MMLKEGDKAIVRTNDGGHFYAGKHVVVIRVLSDIHKKPIRVKAEYGNCESWYAESDLQKVEG